MAAQNAEVNHGVHAIVLADHHGEAAEHILQNGQPLLHMILAVHAELCRAAAGCDDNGLICARRYERRRLYHRMRGACAEAAGVGTGCTIETRNFGGAFCEVAAAALVHVAAGFFGAVDHIFNRILFNARVLYGRKQRQHGRCLGYQVFMHYMCRKVHIDVVRAVHAAHERTVVIQPFGMLLCDQTRNLSRLNAFADARKDRLIHNWVRSKRRLVRGNKRRVKLYKVKHIAGLHQQQELLLRHDLAKLAEAACLRALLVMPRLRHSRKRIRRDVADVDLVWIVGERIFKTADMLRQLF